MLVLQQELRTEDVAVEIWLPDGRVVEVELIDIRNGTRIRMGYTAPDDVKVHRRSVANRIRNERSTNGGYVPRTDGRVTRLEPAKAV